MTRELNERGAGYNLGNQENYKGRIKIACMQIKVHNCGKMR